MTQTLWLFGDINAESAQYLCYEILSSQEEDEICLYINSTGGEVHSALGIINVILQSKVPIRTIVCGSACSMALTIAACGTKGRRQCYPYAVYMYHDVQMSFNEVSSKRQMSGYLDEFDKVTSLEHRLLANASNLSIDDIEAIVNTGHEVYICADEALKMGIVDVVINRGS